MEQIYLINGFDRLSIDNELSNLLKQLDSNENNTVIYDCLEESYFLPFFEELNTYSFLEDRKIIVLRNSENILALEEANQNKLIEYLNRPTETNIVCFVCNSMSFTKGKVNEYLKKNAHIISLENVNDLPSYAKKRFASLGQKIDEKALDLLVSNVKNVESLNNEIEKLISYANNDAITLDMVKELTVFDLENHIYDLSNALLEKDKDKAFRIYLDLIENNEDSIRIINSLSSKMLEILHVKAFALNKTSQEDIAKIFNVSKGRAYYMIKNASAVSKKAINAYIDRLATLDYEFKSGKIDKELGLEMFLLSF